MSVGGLEDEGLIVMADQKLISLVIPLFNEEEIVPTLSARVTEATRVQGVAFEIVVVEGRMLEKRVFARSLRTTSAST